MRKANDASRARAMSLPARYKVRPLKGKWVGDSIEPDWLLIRSPGKDVVRFEGTVRTRTSSASEGGSIATIAAVDHRRE